MRQTRRASGKKSATNSDVHVVPVSVVRHRSLGGWAGQELVVLVVCGRGQREPKSENEGAFTLFKFNSIYFPKIFNFSFTLP
eukprot:scaffold48727_cov38-Cyclotella_meneghiniana.AAC.3